MNLFGTTVEMLRQGTIFASKRHELLAQNVANADTPGFRARDLAFAQELTIAQRATALPAESVGVPTLDPRLVDSPDASLRADGNTVDIDRQMARLAQNTGYQHAVVQLLSARFRALRSAISGQG